MARARLSPQSLAGLPTGVRRPAPAVVAAGVGIVHLGIGAFHRAHQAEYTEDAIATAGGDWRIRGVSLRGTTVHAQLAPQGGLYTLVTRGADPAHAHRVIGAIAGVHVAPREPAAVRAALAEPAVRIVTLTVTEKGYCHDPATGALDLAHPDVAHDLVALREGGVPRSAPGWLVAGLASRRASDADGLAVLSCDNLADNGRLARSLVLDLAGRVDPALARWIEATTAFPSSMVDRIVPATTPHDLDAVECALGVRDEGAVATEAFRQWVVEDEFPRGRPAWEAVGVQLVDDVRPFERAKLRMLNAAHSTLAYLGCLAECEFVHQAVAHPPFARLLERLLRDEAAPTLPRVAGLDPDDYRTRLLARFRDPALRHRCRQIAMDGSRKLPPRLLGTIRDNLAAGRPVGAAALGVAAWMRYATGVDERGQRFEVDDPLAARLRAIYERCGPSAPDLVRGYLALAEVFGTDLPAHAGFVDAVRAHLHALLERGALATTAVFVDADGA